ncbi:MAG TPA: helix-turn-helix transcriptional regulator [Tepidisphaeraceae bacterium]|jgi:DNA-binding CsgD family transcriptional regulator
MKSARITLAQTRRAWRVLAAARDLRHRPAEQATAVVDGLCRLFGGDNGFQLNMADYRPAGRLEARSLMYGSVVDPMLIDWFQGRLGFERTLNDDIMVVHSIARQARTTVLTQSQIWPRVDPRNYPAFAQIRPAYRLEDNLVLMFRPGSTSDMWAYAVHRRDSTTPYSEAERGLAKLLITEMRRLFDIGQLTAPVSPVVDLPRRSAEVLQRLLRGRSPKQIAAEMNLSIYTVRDHVKVLLERFDVSSTPELLASLLNDPNADGYRAALAERAGRHNGRNAVVRAR